MQLEWPRRQTALFFGRFRTVTVIAIGLWFATAGQAQTIADAVVLAWSRNPQVAALAARESEAQARAELAAGMTPTPASVSLSNVSDRFNADAGRETWELEVAVPLWLPGQRAARSREAEGAVAELAASRAALRLQIAGEVRDAWWALAAARNALGQAQWRDASASSLEADVLRRFQAGELARTDANLARNERLAAQGDLLEAQTALRQAELSYQLLTGQNAPVALEGERAKSVPEDAAVHPQLSAAEFAVRLAQARLDVVRQNRRDAPELAVRWVRERGDFGAPYANALGIKLTVPFASDARLRQETAAAQAQVLQADAALVLVRQRIALDAARAQRESEVAQLQWTQAQQRLELAQDTLRLQEKSFALGESDLSTLLRARAAVWEARAYRDRQGTVRAASQSRLNQSMGVLP